MKEQIDITPKSEIKWPQGSKIEVGPDVDFIYIMRKDGKFAMPPIAQKMATDYQLHEEVLTQTFLEEYDTFFAKLADIFKWAYSSRGNFELHLFDPDILESQVRLKSSGQPIVSLDPLMNQGVQEFGVSRGYFLGGTKDFDQVARPGYSTLSNQSHDIATSVNGHPVTVSEDDIFSGGSVIASLNALLESGVAINKVIPGIQIGKPKKLSDMGLSVDPIIEYQTTDGADIFSKLDLGDPRDYLLGASGLVIKLPNGEYGRAPYILPFVSTTARAGIPVEIENEFALKALQANFEFFNTVQDKTGKPVLLKHMDHSFLVYMHQMYGVDPNTEMGQITAWLMENIDGFWETTKKQGEFQEKLALLKLPEDIVFLDVNGTLFPDDAVTGYIPEDDIALLNQAVATVKSKGLAVGLCSDSPLPQLQEIAKKLGVDGPIIAENGNIIFNDGQALTLNELPEIETHKNKIIKQAKKLGFQQTEDCTAPEFGGKQVDVNNSQWSFGANRKTSVTVFGPSQLIDQLGLYFNHQQGFNTDCSPEYNFFAIHPGENYKQNKGYTLNTLSAYGHNIVMVGNSMSDWVEPEHGVVCAFVGGARINGNATNKAGYISDKPTMKGVIDILEKIQ
ncbi:MAG: hypothetical protein A3A47_00250 [Candidatus Levybacteria bacterium RIFCSPLOWO2_01_FULL_37_20]|nr:MAG: hypothetical protein A2770_03175 [Candidatus Levybacteria bacterium RIFCSPHIGHO2_01_FULL_38_12]OGH33973.1 MAG: hypothetical protein A3A47_00250 [Candidatus Levybacteria bacterium RIFCSPLOWO2_01_FULL_37_20]OGH44815.1 MAG: hypothetical protein A3J14_04710 [Candidatus Levybacteria bacterium RIFCSPLOWO2_02_FULL_37_18]